MDIISDHIFEDINLILIKMYRVFFFKFKFDWILQDPIQMYQSVDYGKTLDTSVFWHQMNLA